MDKTTPRTKRKTSQIIWCIVRRTLLTIFTIVILLAIGLWSVCNLIFNGPSESAKNVLTMSLLEASATKWIPGLFIGDEGVQKVQSSVNSTLPADVSSADQVVIQTDLNNGAVSSEWENHPDGIRIEDVKGDTYTAHVMIVRDPSKVFVATSLSPGQSFSTDIPGKPINLTMKKLGTVAAVNGGAFFDNGTGSPSIGSVPSGLVISEGKVVWDDKKSYNGFAGFTEDNLLVVAPSMTAQKAQELNIRDGCCFGPVLIMDGVINESAYNQNSGYNPRTAIGQRADGAIILLCIDGRQLGSLGGTYADIINIMVEYGAVNACNLDGGSSSAMFYKDVYGKYGTEDALIMINSYSLLQETPRRMPTYIMVRSSSEE